MKFQFGANKQQVYLLVLLIAADLAFIILGITYECQLNRLASFCAALPLNEYFAITREKGYAEVFQYLKEYWLTILFVVLAIKQNTKVRLSLVCFSAYLLLDDALGIHEIAGEILGEKLNFMAFFAVRPQDFGEIAFFAIIGLIFFLWFSMSYQQGNSQDRKIFKFLLELLLYLAMFAIVVDLVHMLFDRTVLWRAAIGILEDGGELIVMSIILSFVWSIVTSTTQGEVELITLNKSEQ